jgi:hypothetical protein
MRKRSPAESDGEFLDSDKKELSIQKPSKMGVITTESRESMNISGDYLNEGTFELKVLRPCREYICVLEFNYRDHKVYVCPTVYVVECINNNMSKNRKKDFLATSASVTRFKTLSGKAAIFLITT